MYSVPQRSDSVVTFPASPLVSLAEAKGILLIADTDKTFDTDVQTVLNSALTKVGGFVKVALMDMMVTDYFCPVFATQQLQISEAGDTDLQIEHFDGSAWVLIPSSQYIQDVTMEPAVVRFHDSFLPIYPDYYQYPLRTIATIPAQNESKYSAILKDAVLTYVQAMRSFDDSGNLMMGSEKIAFARLESIIPDIY